MLRFFFDFCKLCLLSKRQKELEILALRSQLAFFKKDILLHNIPKPRVDDRFRRLWVFLSKHFDEWQSALILVNPDTVLGWHRRAFKRYWRRKSVGGRPRISQATIALVKRIHRDNPTLSPEKIHERLVALAITDTPAPNTIARYIRCKRAPASEKQGQAWQSFLKNHAKGIWAMDFAVVPTLMFKSLYVLFIISHDRRKIEHFAVTEYPTAQWTVQQMRNAMYDGDQPEYLIHDNGQPFKAYPVQQFLFDANIKSKSITPHCPWQNGICERLVGTVRRELFDNVVPINQRHLERMLKEYAGYYNNVRTHQFLDGQSPIQSELPSKTAAKDTTLSATPILGGLYHKYDEAA